MSARQMIWNDAFLSTMREMLNQQEQTDLGTWSKRKRSQLVKKPVTLNGNSRNRGDVVVNGCKSEGATRRREGFDGGSNAEFVKFLRYAQRSASEVQSQLYVALDQRDITEQEFHDLYELADSARNKIGGFIAYLLRSDRK